MEKSKDELKRLFKDNKSKMEKTIQINLMVLDLEFMAHKWRNIFKSAWSEKIANNIQNCINEFDSILKQIENE